MANGTLGDFIYLLAAPAWIWVLIYGLRTVKEWPNIMARRNEARRDAAAVHAGDWERLRNEVTRAHDRIDKVQGELDLCHQERDEWRSRAIAAEAVNLGRGEANQQAQRIVSTERQADARKREGDK